MTKRCLYAIFGASCLALLAACAGGATVGSGTGSSGLLPIASSAPHPGTTASTVAGATAIPSPAPVASGFASPTPTSTATTSTGLSFATCGPNDAALNADKPPCAGTSKTTVGTGCTPNFVVTAGGYSSCNIKWIAHFNLPSTTIGGHYEPTTKRYFVTNYEAGFYAFDVSDPNHVAQLGHAIVSLGDPTGLPISEVENEDTLATPTFAVVSNDVLDEANVIDTHDPANMTVIATVPLGEGHTNNCVSTATNACRYDYTTEAEPGDHTLDLTDPTHPVKTNDWIDALGGQTEANLLQVHDITEIHTGLVATASSPVHFLDTTDPVNPKLLFSLPTSAPETGQSREGPAQTGHIGHSLKWPRLGLDRFFLGQSEGIYDGRCELFQDDGRTLYSYDTTNWQSTHNFNLVGSYTLEMGDADEGLAGGVTEVDSNGNPSDATVGFLGCSSHWFEPQENFDNGGLVALSAFSFGVRLLNVSAQGRVQQVGYFVPIGGAHGADTVGVHWIGGRYMATIDFSNGGLDIIEYTGPLPASGPLPLDEHSRASAGSAHHGSF